MNRTRISIGVLTVGVIAASAAADTIFLYDDKPYFSISDSMLTAAAVDFWIEDFEDGEFKAPGVFFNNGMIRGPSEITDSVDSDDGFIDGLGRDGWSLWAEDASIGVTFTFMPDVLGGYPTQAGLVWTDGAPQELVTFQAWDEDGFYLGSHQVVLGDGSYMGTTPEDRFFGVINHTGISAIRVFGLTESIEVDHLQYGLIVPDKRIGRIFRTGFEPDPIELPGYVIGDLTGQNGWFITPGDAAGFVQGTMVRSGLQALELVDGEEVGAARYEMSVATDQPMLVSSYDMLIPTKWNRAVASLDRYEAHTRLALVCADACVWGLEFGVLHVNDFYAGMGAGSTVFYIEVTEGSPENVVASVYEPIEFEAIADNWHNYRMEFHVGGTIARLFVDEHLMAELPFDSAGMVELESVSLANQRWGTSILDSEILFFDNVDVLFEEGIVGDFNDDGFVDPMDLAMLLGNWGACFGCPYDLNEDGMVDAADLAILLGNWQ